MSTKRYVRQSGSGWDVIEEGHRRGTVRTATKKEAVARARESVRRAGGGEVRIVNVRGKIVEADVVEPAGRRAPRR